MLDALRRPLTSPWALALLVGACVLLGALHALTPGHGKTLLAAYLVGSHGTARRAVGLGLVLTVTHTAAVLALGVALLAAGRWVVPGVVTPALTVAAGLVVLLLGVRLLWRRRRPQAMNPGHGHGHGHAPQGWRGTVAMGVTGGLVPCPEALGVLLLAVGVGRTGLGLGMIVAFSVGLAAVLVGLGLALVVAGPRLARAGGDRAGRITATLPLLSAVVVTVLGLVMAVGGLSGLVG